MLAWPIYWNCFLVQRSLWVALNVADVVLLTWVLSSWHPHFIKHQSVLKSGGWSFFLFKNTLIQRFSRKGVATEVGVPKNFCTVTQVFIVAVHKNTFRIELYNQYGLKVQTVSCNLRVFTSKLEQGFSNYSSLICSRLFFGAKSN